MYDGRSGCVNWREKKRAEARLSASTVRSSVRLYRSVDDFHLVAAVPARLGGLGKRAFAAVVVAHHDLVFLFLLDRFLDLVSAEGAADRAEDGGEVLAAAASDLMAENAADDRAADRADARRLPGLLDGFRVHAALGRFRRLGLRGLLGDRRHDGARVLADRGRYPAHDGSDSGQAEEADRAGSEDDERMGATRCIHEDLLRSVFKTNDTDAASASKFV